MKMSVAVAWVKNEYSLNKIHIRGKDEDSI